LTITISSILQQVPPKYRPKKPKIEERKKVIPLKPEEIQNIYKYDLFGTFVAKEFVPAAQQLVTPIPQPKTITMPKAPSLPTVAFLPPLTLTLKGIAYSSDESKSISIIEDETKKENVYHAGDMFKDAQIIKIAQNRVTMLRTNGQHETVFLRKEDNKLFKEKDKKEKTWDHLSKKVDENVFEIDPRQFTEEMPSLGVLAEQFGLLTTYATGKPIGIQLTTLEEKGLGTSIGLQKNDIIISINGMNAADKKERVKIYDTVSKAKMGDTLKIELSRANSPVTLTYKLADIRHVVKRIFAPDTNGKPTEVKKAPETLMKLSKLQQREQQRRKFAKRNPARKKQHKNLIQNLRQRLLQNIRAKARNARIIR